MKIKKIYIGIKSLDASLKEAGGVFTQLAKGKKIKPKSAVYFSNLKEMRRALTERRLELLKTIKDERPSSVYQLSKLLNRDLKNVLQDVSYLNELGIIEVTKTGDKKIPQFHYDKISFEVAI
jgi:predicted transcriptional regulator